MEPSHVFGLVSWIWLLLLLLFRRRRRVLSSLEGCSVAAGVVVVLFEPMLLPPLGVLPDDDLITDC